ncbi:hypothetical protein [Mesorhizobium sp. CA5]|uniref:hypothetical protein n=1 Tax=Mesorhizobium sp. CA5 TaxID=2876638 RepID=UPI001CD0D41D|nr:hypothetical protein [Mesorhizobium sp. CA5]MBZ9844370.1 hypothetical protein [Mesorhizobium sp. CA5]
MAIRLKNMAVSLKTRPVVAKECGNETAGANQRLARLKAPRAETESGDAPLVIVLVHVVPPNRCCAPSGDMRCFGACRSPKTAAHFWAACTGKIEHVSSPIASNLPVYPMSDRRGVGIAGEIT